ncbi:hypothetical protein [Actinokineospora cianjurensis]|uniref:Uncharacterized protein n=1 Tax=Actinokineospora cianjurensis TaxID=585224 RepID=A0A421AYH3_9PSEU|nr:hypothetical protein [Actinokineospora cianjurensis]RLK54845.1 hypothetical protein CLV68_5234 [Actinokineospora cianjurensis]
MTGTDDLDIYAPTPCLLGCVAPGGEPFPAQHGYRTCDLCADRLRATLTELVELYALVDDAVVPGRGGSAARGAPGHGSRSPARDSVIVLTDPRTHAVEDGDPHSVLAVLSSWADNVRSDTGQDPRTGAATVSGEVALLVRWMDWMTRQYWIGDLGQEVDELAHQLRAALGLQERTIPVGPCPNRVTDPDTGRTVTCGAPLRARLSVERIRCRRCRASWPRERWDELGGELGVPVSDFASLSAWLATPTGTLRRWRHEDRWANHGTKARPVFARTDALASWRRRHAPAAPV